jgi:hypothetical protein
MTLKAGIRLGPHTRAPRGTAENARPYVDADEIIQWTTDAPPGALGGTRTTTTLSAALSALGQATGSFALAKGTELFGIRETFGRACRVRLYDTSAARDADAARAATVSAVSGSYPAGTGCWMDCELDSNTSHALDFSPVPVVGDAASPPTTTVYYTVDNYTNVALTLDLELRHTPIEA